MKTNIKLRVTPEQSEAVQKICFANNIQPWGLTDKVVRNLDQAFISISKNKILGIYNYALGDNKFYFWDKDEKEEVDADLFIRTNGTCEESIDIIDNSSNNKSKENMFKQYGFEVPDFDCELLGSISAPNNQKLIVGVIRKSVLNISSYLWSLDGTCFNCSVSPDFYEYNLTPIKKPWYETCKFPVLAKNILRNEELVIITGYKENYLLSTYYQIKPESIIPLTNNEIDQLKQDF